MDKIEVGEYIRTKTHGIKRVIRINEKATKNRYIVYYGIDKEGDKTYITINIDDVINHSKNIIDLIEEGDIVNGEQVKYVDDCKGAMREFYYDEEGMGIGYWFNDIETILTKEQYEENCYKVEE